MGLRNTTELIVGSCSHCDKNIMAMIHCLGFCTDKFGKLFTRSRLPQIGFYEKSTNKLRKFTSDVIE
jgi:hypothetical protein